MNYILLAAGKGTRLHPLTNNIPKCLYNLNENLTVIQAMINGINKYDKNATIYIVTGFQHKLVEESIYYSGLVDNIQFIHNPFYNCTNSIASLWFARDYLQGDVTIINADIVVDDDLMKDIIISKTDSPLILLDSSIKTDGDYNVQVNENEVVVMSKDLKNYYGEYAGITKLDYISNISLYNEIERIIEDGHYDQWYENALVQLIFNHNFKLYFTDISRYNWTEVDCVDDLVKAKEISNRNGKM